RRAAQTRGHAPRAGPGGAGDAAGGEGGARSARHPQPGQGGGGTALFPALLAPTDRPALSFPDGALTYAELADRAGALARELAGLGRVAVWATPTSSTAVGIVAAPVAGVPARAAQ